mgnify:FL=1
MYSQSNNVTWTYSYAANGTEWTQVSTHHGVYKQFVPKRKNIQYKYLLSQE